MPEQKKTIPKERAYQITIGVMAAVIVILFLMAGRTSYLLDEQRKLNSGQPQTIQTAEAALETPFEPISLAGSGNKVTDPFMLSSGGYKLSLANSGTANFVVEMLDENGNKINDYLVANEIGTSNTTKAINVPSGKYFFNVMSDGDWTIKIEKL